MLFVSSVVAVTLKGILESTATEAAAVAESLVGKVF